MTFGNRLEEIMRKSDLTQRQVCDLTGLCPSSISQYLSGTHEPSKARKREIALALGMDENYFEFILPEFCIKNNAVFNLKPQLAAKLMGKSVNFIYAGLQDKRFDFGYAVKMKQWDYWISSVKFTERTGIEIPVNEIETGNREITQ